MQTGGLDHIAQQPVESLREASNKKQLVLSLHRKQYCGYIYELRVYVNISIYWLQSLHFKRLYLN